MTGFTVHIVAFDIPYPPNYGGAMDVFHKIRSLKNFGVKIILHCFQYNQRAQAPELEDFCFKVYYYPRNTTFTAHLSYLPYTVYSRKNELLLSRLSADNYPVIFEGLMSCFYLGHPKLKNKVKIYRESNIEHDYYMELFKATHKWSAKPFYLVEALKHRWFEKTITNATLSLVVSTNDCDQLKRRYPGSRIEFMPSFHPHDEINTLTGLSDYALYHGNLSVAENENAAIYLSENVFSKLPCRCVVSGMNPSARLIHVVGQYPNIELIANPANEEMEALVKGAQINIFVTGQATGLKLKLLNALYSGRHVVVNSKMLAGSGLDAFCYVANDSQAQIALCNKLMQMPFTGQMIKERRNRMSLTYSNSANAEKLIALLTSCIK